jgi:hypothetical protein
MAIIPHPPHLHDLAHSDFSVSLIEDEINVNVNITRKPEQQLVEE